MFLLLCLQCSQVLTNEWTQIRLKDSNSQCTSALPKRLGSCDRLVANMSTTRSNFGHSFPEILSFSSDGVIQVCLIVFQNMCSYRHVVQDKYTMCCVPSHTSY